MEQIAARAGARGELTPSHDNKSPVAIVGFGLLGEVFAQRLLAAAWPVVAYDPAGARREVMASLSVESLDDVAGAAGRAACVLLAVYDAAQVREVLRELATMPRAEALTVLCTTTLAPDDARAIADEHARGTLRFIELPVSGSSRQVLEGGALALVGSDEPLAPPLQALVQVLCPRQIEVGARGAAACMKLVINLVLEINRAALAEGLTLAQAFGLDLRTTEQALRDSAAASRLMELQAPKMRTGDFAPYGRLAQSLKDMDAMMVGGRERFLPLGSAARELLASCVRAGEGALDSAAIVAELRRRATREGALPC